MVTAAAWAPHRPTAATREQDPRQRIVSTPARAATSETMAEAAAEVVISGVATRAAGVTSAVAATLAAAVILVGVVTSAAAEATLAVVAVAETFDPMTGKRRPNA